jgi:hypothetical protein
MGNVHISDAADGCRIENGSLAISARWTGDQWLISLEHDTTEGWVSFAESTEVASSADDVAIEVPVFQQKIARINSDGCGELLLIGQFGRRHFSGVVTIGTEGISIEIADRWIVPLPLSQLLWKWRCSPNIVIGERDQRPLEGEIVFDHSDATITFANGTNVHFPLQAACEEDELTMQGEIASTPLAPGTMQYSCRFLVAR